MTEEPLRDWMERRFDMLAKSVEDKTDRLQKEIVDSRHGIKEVVQTISIEVAENTAETRANTHRIAAINDWRGDDGPLKREFRRVRSEIADGDRNLADKMTASDQALDARIDSVHVWRHTIRGGLIAVSVFVPIVTGIVVGVVMIGMNRALPG